MLLQIVALQIIIVSVSASVIFEDCGSAYDLHTVNIDGCNMRLPCYVTLGEEVPVSVEFYADFESRKLDQNVVLNINLVNLNTEVNPDPCETVDCPLRSNAKTSFTSIMSIPTRIALNQRGHLYWRVHNEAGQQVLCYSVLVQTQSKLQKMLRQALAEHAASAVDDIADHIDLRDKELNLNITQDYVQQLIEQYYSKRTLLNNNNL